MNTLERKKQCPLTVHKPTHNVESKGKWRHSITTVDEDGACKAWTTNGDAQNAPSLWKTDSRKHDPPLTNGSRSQLREQTTGRVHDCRELSSALVDTTGFPSVTTVSANGKKSRTKRFLETQPRPAKTPALEHAARQVREESHKRRRRNTQKSCGRKRERAKTTQPRKEVQQTDPIANA